MVGLMSSLFLRPGWNPESAAADVATGGGEAAAAAAVRLITPIRGVRLGGLEHAIMARTMRRPGREVASLPLGELSPPFEITLNAPVVFAGAPS